MKSKLNNGREWVGWGAVYTDGGREIGETQKTINVEILLGVCAIVVNSPSNLT